VEVDAPKGIWQSDNKKREKQQQNTKKMEIGHNFLIDFLFFIPHEKKFVHIYLKEKNGQTPELA